MRKPWLRFKKQTFLSETCFNNRLEDSAAGIDMVWRCTVCEVMMIKLLGVKFKCFTRLTTVCSQISQTMWFRLLSALSEHATAIIFKKCGLDKKIHELFFAQNIYYDRVSLIIPFLFVNYYDFHCYTNSGVASNGYALCSNFLMNKS